jgi:hypothetical protein
LASPPAPPLLPLSVIQDPGGSRTAGPISIHGVLLNIQVSTTPITAISHSAQHLGPYTPKQLCSLGFPIHCLMLLQRWWVARACSGQGCKHACVQIYILTSRVGPEAKGSPLSEFATASSLPTDVSTLCTTC